MKKLKKVERNRPLKTLIYDNIYKIERMRIKKEVGLNQIKFA